MIWRQISRQALQTFPTAAARTGRSVPAVLLQKAHRRRRTVTEKGPVFSRPVAASSAAATHASQMKTRGPATSFSTSLGGRPHQVQAKSGWMMGMRHMRRHNVTPALSRSPGISIAPPAYVARQNLPPMHLGCLACGGTSGVRGKNSAYSLQNTTYRKKALRAGIRAVTSGPMTKLCNGKACTPDLACECSPRCSTNADY
jgi:hypothetical protein